jgi:hypothetical protein
MFFWRKLAPRCGPQAVLALLVATANCTGIRVVEVKRQGSGTVPGNEVLSEHVVDLPPVIEMNISTQEASEQAGVDAIEGLYLDRLVLRLDSSRNADSFDFLESIEIYAEDLNGEPLLIAVGEQFPRGARSVEMTPTGVNIVDLLQLEHIKVSSKMRGRHPSRDLDITVDAEFLADVDLKTASCAANG